MLDIFLTATIWLALAIVATAIASKLRLSIALIEIVVGVAAAAFATHYFGEGSLRADEEWLRFVAASGAILLTFLAGAELDTHSLRTKRWEVMLVGMVGFLAPFLGCTAIAYFLLGWDPRASWLVGVALSTTSVAVVYAVMIEYGFNKTEFGKGVLGACFVNDLGTVIALGLLFAPMDYRTAIFVLSCVLVFFLLPRITRKLTDLYGFRTAAIRTKWVLLVLFGLGTLAIWSGSEAVLPAYIAGMVLADTLPRDHFYMRRLRTLTVGFLTPFYFIRAGSFVSLPALIQAPLVFLALLAAKLATKTAGLYPLIGRFREHQNERWYYTLLMSTGLTFGTISALFGLTHGIVDKEQYSFLVAAVIASAVVPTLIANARFLPSHLLAPTPVPDEELLQLEEAALRNDKRLQVRDGDNEGGR